MTSLRPLEDRVVLKVLDAEEKTAGGILLPDTAKEKPQRGKVTAVGLPGALAVSSGQSAELLAILTLAEAGSHIVSSPSLYGGTYNLFESSSI